jgi:hypothetical protein
VTLLLVFLMMFLGLFALFLGGGLVAQGYLYQQPADRMPVRAVAAAVLVGGYVTFWVWIDHRAPKKYDTFFNFEGESKTEFNEFEAVRWSAAAGKLTLDASGKPTESTVPFKRIGKEAPFQDAKTGGRFELTGRAPDGAQYMTGALLVKGPGDAQPARYNARLNEDKTYQKGDEGVRFIEEKGSRYIKAGELGALYVPSTATIAVALLLNFLLLVVWVVAFWPIMRFSLGHSLMFTAVLAVITLLGLMPILFKPNRAPKPPPTPPTALVPHLGAHPAHPS